MCAQTSSGGKSTSSVTSQLLHVADFSADWAQYLAWTHNATQIDVYAYAEWGATVENSVFFRNVPSFADQYSYYAQTFQSSPVLPWHGNNSLFCALRDHCAFARC
jgi:hypothetical protein